EVLPPEILVDFANEIAHGTAWITQKRPYHIVASGGWQTAPAPLFGPGRSLECSSLFPKCTRWDGYAPQCDSRSCITICGRIILLAAQYIVICITSVRHDMGWTEERIELLQRLWLQGQTASQIAEQLGDGVTRNAVIGKAHRLGLSGR